MKLTTSNLFALICLAACSTASANTYVNLSPLDNASFSNSKGQNVTLSVSAFTLGWNKYSNFLGTGARKVWAQDGSEAVYVLNESTNTAEKLVNFADPVGSSYNFSFAACNTGGTLAQKGLTLATPVGTFKDVVRMTFDAKCADSGILEAWFAPQVGVIKWSSQTIAGANTFELSSGKVGGQNLGLQSALKAVANFPKTAFLIGNTTELAAASFTLTNTSNQNMVLHFASGQEFEISLLNSNYQVLNTWSARVRFVQGSHDVTIAPGQSKSFGGNLALQYVSGNVLAAGIYTLRLELKAASYAVGSNPPTAGTLSTDMPILVNLAL